MNYLYWNKKNFKIQNKTAYIIFKTLFIFFAKYTTNSQ